MRRFDVPMRDVVTKSNLTSIVDTLASKKYYVSEHDIYSVLYYQVYQQWPQFENQDFRYIDIVYVASMLLKRLCNKKKLKCYKNNGVYFYSGH